ADTVLDRPERVEVLQLGSHRGLGVTDHAPQSDQRRLANGLGDVLVDLATKRLGERHGYSSALREWKKVLGASWSVGNWAKLDKTSSPGETHSGQTHPLQQVGLGHLRSDPFTAHELHIDIQAEPAHLLGERMHVVQHGPVVAEVLDAALGAF